MLFVIVQLWNADTHLMMGGGSARAAGMTEALKACASCWTAFSAHALTFRKSIANLLRTSHGWPFSVRIGLGVFVMRNRQYVVYPIFACEGFSFPNAFLTPDNVSRSRGEGAVNSLFFLWSIDGQGRYAMEHSPVLWAFRVEPEVRQAILYRTFLPDSYLGHTIMSICKSTEDYGVLPLRSICMHGLKLSTSTLRYSYNLARSSHSARESTPHPLHFSLHERHRE